MYKICIYILKYFFINCISEPRLEQNNEREKWRCFSRESLTCLMLSAIVIGLPIAIIIILMNLPKLSTRGDTRQQHYILLAFGFPFSLVFIVAVLYGSFRAIMHFKRGSDQSRHLQPRLSWRNFSRRFRSRHFHREDELSESELSASTRFYSLVTQVMAQQQVFPENDHQFYQTQTPIHLVENNMKESQRMPYH